MTNKTFIPAFKAHVGDWNYYICTMKYAQVAREVQFAHELGGNKDLNNLIQRGIGNRTDEIVEYLKKSEHRFLGALIVAAWGGDPEYVELSMDDPEGMLKGVDSGFGVLTLDGSHSFFALDGQHRLKAIKEAIKSRPDLGKEDICVLLVAHNDTPAGRERTQRLFTNINRNAKTTTAAENIALDVDDGIAVITRQLLTEHDLFARAGLVRIFSKSPNDDGQFTLAGKQVPKSDPHCWTTITVLYQMLRELSFGLDVSLQDPTTRPSDEVLQESYLKLAERLTNLLDAVGLRAPLEANQSARELRVPKADEGRGHPFMRPVVQLAVARALQVIVDQELLTFGDALTRLQALKWQLKDAPWTSVYNTESGNMITAKENGDLLEELVRVHLAPINKAEVTRARKLFRELRGSNYPVAQEDLEKNLIEVK